MIEILTVCTGNICRSPLAAVALQHRLTEWGVASNIRSAGTQGLTSAPMTPEAQRLAVAAGVPEADAAAHRSRALTEDMLSSPDLILADEPVSSLDIGYQLMVMRLARAFAAEGGGVVAVLHDLNLTAAHADRVLLLQDGQVTAQGTPAEVLTPARLTVVYGCDLQVHPLRTAVRVGAQLLDDLVRGAGEPVLA